MTSPYSDFDVDIDEEDLRQIEIAEQEAISNLQLSSFSLQLPFSTPSNGSPRSSNPLVPKSPSKGKSTASPSQTLPWLQPPPSSLVNRNPGQQVKGRSRADEPPTHHYIDTTAAKTWIYPTNVSFRDYQFNIVQRALFDNILVSLPTGLGKTFIAATVMFNYYRWFPRSKIIFVAPTKPLVSQQVEACFKICGVPYSHTAQLTGNVAKPQRATAYEERRVFYMTPQTLSNDLKSGLCDPKSVVCLVIDEAHRGTGNYAYGECVALIRKQNPSLRILALSATPGANVEAVQNVINALCIARIEIRIETSIDLRAYIHKRRTDVITLPLGKEITSLRDLFAKVIQKFLDRVKNLNDPRLRDPLTLSLFGVKTARDALYKSSRGINPALAGMMAAVLGILGTLAHAMSLLIYHGIQPFFEKLESIQHEYESQGRKLSKTKSELLSNSNFQELMTRLRVLVDNPNTVGHPKLERAASMIIEHFVKMEDEKQDSRAIVFSQYRSSAAELVKQLRRQEPIIKPTIFVGQSADTRGASGMKQKEQLEVIQKFKDGEYNVLVATCIGEEGLDIGDVDLIICYDSSSSPVRMLQRMGRTGRKREGRVVFLLTQGKEERDHIKSQDAYEKIQQKIASGNDFEFNLDNSPRILPKEIQPDCVKKEIIPPNETLDALELKVDRRKKVPKTKKDWSLPENVQTGFVRASALGKRQRKVSVEDDGDVVEPTGFVHPDTLVSPFLSREEENRARQQRVHVSPSPCRVDILDTNTTGNIPASSLRNRLVQTHKAMKNSTRSKRTYTDIEKELLTSTPPGLIVSDPVRSSLTERDVNVSSLAVKSESRKQSLQDVEDELSSGNDLPDLSTELLFNTKGSKSRKKDSSDDEYGLPSDFEETPRKRIRIADLSDEE